MIDVVAAEPVPLLGRGDRPGSVDLGPRGGGKDVRGEGTGAAGNEGQSGDADRIPARDRRNNAAAIATEPVRGRHHEPGRKRVADADPGLPIDEIRVGDGECEGRGITHPIVTAPNAIATIGGVPTMIEAVAVPPAPLSLEVIEPVVLTLVPEEVPLTFTENVQLSEVLSASPARLTVPPPATAVIVPPQSPVKTLGVAT